ncbi:SigE family RNA polymerase sigma factor [Stackebrandtia nassauensis]|uniref:RNA polymerase, sigma-24 subunit, ECF subfamily n=1 Tax=Stackebrandtia nassauensis (strain DSM 44728 / CIP 108903 / NRRL B-16338 / NBRC 102104 / LLR-40K-21) TaxID=446470 RepID=D3QAB5_STANL|nr:SigE family RNA polymerase sigma factor [Stackebrandtia nassauensis]ADD42698.1 RNA polymerase, sigma-24 subunit, ECF subfamily [Stackebrandtia nassauensis DSM 44728]
MTPLDEREFNDFVAARFDRLGRFAYLLCGDWHRSEDAVQKAFTKLYLVWSKRDIRSPDAYVRRIIVNVINDDYRLGFLKRERVVDELPDRLGPDGSEASDDRLMVLAALTQLPKRQRTAVVLRYWEDLPIEQVAEIMKCTTGAVKSQSSRGLAALRAIIDGTRSSHDKTPPEGLARLRPAT